MLNLLKINNLALVDVLEWQLGGGLVAAMLATASARVMFAGGYLDGLACEITGGALWHLGR